MTKFVVRLIKQSQRLFAVIFPYTECPAYGNREYAGEEGGYTGEEFSGVPALSNGFFIRARCARTPHPRGAGCACEACIPLPRGERGHVTLCTCVCECNAPPIPLSPRGR